MSWYNASAARLEKLMKTRRQRGKAMDSQRSPCHHSNRRMTHMLTVDSQSLSLARLITKGSRFKPMNVRNSFNYGNGVNLTNCTTWDNLTVQTPHFRPCSILNISITRKTSGVPRALKALAGAAVAF